MTVRLLPHFRHSGRDFHGCRTEVGGLRRSCGTLHQGRAAGKPSPTEGGWVRIRDIRSPKIHNHEDTLAKRWRLTTVFGCADSDVRVAKGAPSHQPNFPFSMSLCFGLSEAFAARILAFPCPESWTCPQICENDHN